MPKIPKTTLDIGRQAAQQASASGPATTNIGNQVSLNSGTNVSQAAARVASASISRLDAEKDAIQASNFSNLNKAIGEKLIAARDKSVEVEAAKYRIQWESELEQQLSDPKNAESRTEVYQEMEEKYSSEMDAILGRATYLSSERLTQADELYRTDVKAKTGLKIRAKDYADAKKTVMGAAEEMAEAGNLEAASQMIDTSDFLTQNEKDYHNLRMQKRHDLALFQRETATMNPDQLRQVYDQMASGELDERFGTSQVNNMMGHIGSAVKAKTYKTNKAFVDTADAIISGEIVSEAQLNQIIEKKSQDGNSFFTDDQISKSKELLKAKQEQERAAIENREDTDFFGDDDLTDFVQAVAEIREGKGSLTGMFGSIGDLSDAVSFASIGKQGGEKGAAVLRYGLRELSNFYQYKMDNGVRSEKIEKQDQLMDELYKALERNLPNKKNDSSDLVITQFEKVTKLIEAVDAKDPESVTKAKKAIEEVNEAGAQRELMNSIYF